MSTINERLANIVSIKGLTPRAFAIKVGTSSQVFGKYLKDRDPSFEVLRGIVEAFDDISAEWLLTGKGEMLTVERAEIMPIPDLFEILKYNARTIESQQRLIEDLAKKRDDVAGSGHVATEAAQG